MTTIPANHPINCTCIASPLDFRSHRALIS
jgi:hypothetical protein